jgi:hypothetical protein
MNFHDEHLPEARIWKIVDRDPSKASSQSSQYVA